MGRTSKILAASVATLIGVGVAYAVQANANTAPIVVEAATKKPATIEAVVKVLVDGGRGSGVHIGNGFIITAAHVLPDASYYRAVEFKNGAEFPFEVLWKSNQYDIAAIRIRDIKADNPKVTPPKVADQGAAELFCGNLVVGDDVSVIGNPMSEDFITSFGRIAGDARKVHVDSVYVVDISVIMGVSGGPMFHAGAVAGIASAIMTAPLQYTSDVPFTPTVTGYSYFVPSSIVCELIARF